MSHDPNLAITLPGQPLFYVAPAVLIVVTALVIVLVRRSRAKKKRTEAWGAAADELGIRYVPKGSDLGAVIRGRVNDHVITVSPGVMGNGRKARSHTVYGVKYEAPEAPKFALTKRTTAKIPVVDTGNPKFDAVVAVDTDNPALLRRFLTPPRRAAILRLLMHWPDSKISNREALLATADLENDQLEIVDTVCHLVAAAETFDRPTRITPVTIDGMTGVAAGIQGHAQTGTAQAANGGQADGTVLTDVRLDEMTVIHDLFDTGLAADGIAARFAQLYQGQQVTWTGEVVRSSMTDDSGGQRIAALIGSADGQHPSSGRVVAITTVAPHPLLNPGDVVTFSGELANLVAERRLFQLI